MARAGTENGISNGLGTAPPPNGGAGPTRTLLREHPLVRHGAKLLLGALLLGLVSGAGWLVTDLRDDVRDHGAKVEGIAPLKVRLRAVEDAAIETRSDMRWIKRSLRRIERAAGVE